MGFLGDIAKGVGRELKLGARVGISSMAQGIKTNVKRPTSVDKANPYGIFKYPPGSKVPKAGIRAQGTWRELQKNTKPPVPQADISIFGGKAFVTKEKRMEWLKKHKNEIYQITRGRVTERKLAEFDKEIFQKFV